LSFGTKHLPAKGIVFMLDSQRPLRVLHSFPHRLGKARICTTAWYEIDSAAAAGADMQVLAGDSVRPFQRPVSVRTTLSRGKIRIPYRLLGTLRACALHDWLVARALPNLAGKVDIIHAWPLGALNTIKAARRLGIPVALERCNAHTRFAYEVVQKECERLGVPLPKDHEHAYNASALQREEEEYNLADAILCPSDFVVKTFLDQGFPREKLTQHQYGFDEKIYYPDSSQTKNNNHGLTVLFVGGCAPRKGLHYALEAWLKSPAHRDGTFMIAGAFVPGYAEKLSGLLSHPSVQLLGFRKDVPELMRRSDILVLPTIEEGSALVTSEARGSGCVLLVSEAAGAVCKHGENALVHVAGDVATLAKHMIMLYEDRMLLERLRASSLTTVQEITWRAAGKKLFEVYKEIIYR
jgi:glycosyltransferase involved in cell wall biosynthesis